ncbi:hypothetical protein [Streptomyces sp. ISL-11]|uniref:hypothetical protein n=1 Tax=Streptomyces sp. ISL-11 TaxID=2819174 RepID=UPI001BEBA9A2|nr:hypothetical protein [Streptomyces sp. ISL-11]MBT2382980.1 hypothetical protein [Streptomyces sp. ISL-11]
MVSAVDPRTAKTCSNPVALPVGEAFRPFSTVTMYSLPFHAPAGRAVDVDLAAELDDPTGNPALGSVGVRVFQCCSVLDSEITDAQKNGSIGAAGHPAATRLSLTLSNKCTIPTKFGEEFVYYLQLRISFGSGSVHLSYSVR